MAIAPLLLSSCQSTGLPSDLLNSSQNILGQIIGTGTTNTALSQTDIASAFKQALQIGTGEVVSQLGTKNGFNLDPQVHIPLPNSLATVQNTLNKVGLSFMLDDLETKINHAAEIATPHAKELFLNAISEMTFDDVMAIYNGPEDSATRFFKSKMSAPLMDKMTPFINNAVSQAGAVQAYDQVMSQYSAIPFVPDVKADLTNYVTQKGIDGIFHYLAQQEAQIRQDPVRHTTELLKKVFGSK
ncbi:MAG: DUF4197 domain-containing protein [Bdellovibrionales bacterium]